MLISALAVSALICAKVPDREPPDDISAEAAAAPIVPTEDAFVLKLKEAKRRLKAARFASRRIGGMDALLAVASITPEEAKIRIITVRGGESRTRGFKVRLVARNGVNTEYEVVKPEGYQVLAIKTNVRDPVRHSKPAVYVPSHVAARADIISRVGRQYLIDLTDQASALLEKREVYSMAVDDALVTETVPARVVITLFIVEHITPSDIDRDGVRAVVERVLATVGANEDDAYDYSVSRARARGIAQFIRSSYRLTRQRYEKARLAADFASGMSDHLNAAMSTFCLLDWSLTTLPQEALDLLLTPGAEEDVGAFLAAAYNGGENRAAAAYVKDAKNWEQPGNGLRPETVTYVRTFRAVYRQLFSE